MTRKALIAGLRELAEHFHAVKELDAYTIRVAWWQFRHLPLALWRSTITRATIGLARFPEPGELWQFVPPPSWSKGRHGDADPDHAKEAMALILRILHGQCRGAWREAAFATMAERYPGIGWDAAAVVAIRDAERDPER